MELPEPNEYGDHWLDDHSRIEHRPAIFRSAIDEKYILTFGQRGFVFDGPKLKRYPNAKAALKDYEKLSDVCLAS